MRFIGIGYTNECTVDTVLKNDKSGLCITATDTKTGDQIQIILRKEERQGIKETACQETCERCGHEFTSPYMPKFCSHCHNGLWNTPRK